MFIYRRIVMKKYGVENGLIYENGNRYAFTRNLLTCLLIVILVIIDAVIAKQVPELEAFGFGESTYALFLIPCILLYRPHLGKRNAKWDLIYPIIYIITLIGGLALTGVNIISYLITL